MMKQTFLWVFAMFLAACGPTPQELQSSQETAIAAIVPSAIASVKSTLMAEPTPLPTTPPQPTRTVTPVPSATPTPKIGSTQVSIKDGMVLIYVPAGDFLMGSDRELDPQAEDFELPQHTVYLDGFWIDKTEVTNAKFALCVKAGACQPPREIRSNIREVYYGNPDFADFPAIFVDWNQANAYCAWAERSLPSEAQWEKAARGTRGQIYPWGNAEPDCLLSNNSDCSKDTSKVDSHPSGASPYGALDMAGNVYEWVLDRYKPFTGAPQSALAAPSIETTRGLRGGSWYSDDTDVRSAFRAKYGSVTLAHTDIGFRCARP